MYFRSHYDFKVKKQNLDDPLIFLPSSKHLFKIIIRKWAEGDLRANPRNGHILEAHFKAEMLPVHENFLERLYKSVIEPQKDGEYLKYRNEDGVVVKYPQIDSDSIPDGFKRAVENLNICLSSEAKDFISILRWRLDQHLKDSDVIPRRHQFSLDQQLWYPVPKSGPTATIVDVWFTPARPLPEHIKQDILNIYNQPDNEGEPFYHPLLRDAWDQQGENPHSAIVMGIATIEAAVKHCISNLQPETAWFLEEINSPPLDAMLSRYLPTVTTKAPNEQFGIIPDQLRKIISKGVSARNKIVHTGKIPETKGFSSYHQNLRGKTKELLSAIKDLLWLLDYYQGNDWALDYLRPETLKVMKEKFASR